MSSRAVLHAGPAVGFDQPFEMLAACHDRVRRSLDLLQRLQAHVLAQGLDAQARDAAADVLRYFDLAAPAHHEDEERHVLPRLEAAGLAALAQRLRTEHAEMTRQWGQLRLPLQAWVSGAPAVLAEAELMAYVTLYEAHLATEDGTAFPTACRLADDVAQRLMGEEMAARRRP